MLHLHTAKYFDLSAQLANLHKLRFNAVAKKEKADEIERPVWLALEKGGYLAGISEQEMMDMYDAVFARHNFWCKTVHKISIMIQNKEMEISILIQNTPMI